MNPIKIKTVKVELKPVLELSVTHPDVPFPESSYSENKEAWDAYNRNALANSGFSASMANKGHFDLYLFSDFSDADLLQLIRREIDRQQTDENKGIDDLVGSFSGGYLLRIDGEDKYWPQCCGCLADIEKWEQLLSGKQYLHAGHPTPLVTINENTIALEFGIEFSPPVKEAALEIEKSALHDAITNTKKELDAFAKRLSGINAIYNLNIPDIGTILIYGKPEDE